MIKAFWCLCKQVFNLFTLRPQAKEILKMKSAFRGIAAFSAVMVVIACLVIWITPDKSKEFGVKILEPKDGVVLAQYQKVTVMVEITGESGTKAKIVIGSPSGQFYTEKVDGLPKIVRYDFVEKIKGTGMFTALVTAGDGRSEKLAVAAAVIK